MQFELDQAQVQSLRLRPTLIVGLGEFGKTVLEQIQAKLTGHFGAEPDFPILERIWLDVGQGLPPAGVTRVALALEEADILGRRLQAPSSDYLRRWWYPGWASLEDFGPLSRPAGRLRFFLHFSALRQALQEGLTRLRDPEHATRLLASQVLREQGMLAQILFDQPTQVHLVGCAEDGLGGMWCDLGFLLRELMVDANLVRTGWLSLDPASSQRERANAYALLKEVRHYSADGHGFECEWEPGRWARPQAGVLEHCYLQPGSASEVAELIADFLAKDLLLSEFAEQRRSLRRNLQSQSVGPFSQVGLARITLPLRAMQRAASARVASGALQTLVDQGESGGTPPMLWGDEKAIRKAWLTSLVDDGLTRISQWGAESWRSLQRGHRSLSHQLGRILQQGQRWVDEELLPPLSGRTQALREKESTRLRNLCLEAVERQGRDLGDILTRVREAELNLQRWLEWMRRQTQSLVDLQQELAVRVARQEAELARAQSRSNWDGRRSLLILHYARLILDLHVGSWETPGLLAARVLEEAHRQAALLCRELIAFLKAPGGELPNELDILRQQILAAWESQRAIWTSVQPWREQPSAFNLCTESMLVQEVIPRYVTAEVPAQLVRSLEGGVLACLDGERFSQQLNQRCRTLWGRLSRDYSVFSRMGEWEPRLPEWLARAELGKENSYSWIGVPAPSPGQSALEKAQWERGWDRLQQLLQQRRGGWGNVVPLSHSEDLFFFQEAVGQSADTLIELAPLRDAYFRAYAEGEPLHMDGRDQQFEELARPGLAELAALREAREAFWLGQLLGLLQEQDGEWLWREPGRVTVTLHPLGNRHRLFFRLSHAPRLRARLLLQSRQALEDLLQVEQAEPLVELARSIGEAKHRCWIAREEGQELTFLKELESRIQASSTYRAHVSLFQAALP